MPRGRPKKIKEATDDSIGVVTTEESLSVTPRTESEVPGFDLLNNSDRFINSIQEALINSKSKNKASFISMDNLIHNYVEYKHFALQALTSTKGMIPGSVIEVIGPESTGKTTLMLYLMGNAIEKGSPALYINSEAKWLSKSRMLRILNSDKKKAAKIFSLITVSEIFELKHMINSVESWVSDIRKNTVIPNDTPLIVGIDTLSKLMPPGEAAGIYAEGGYTSDALTKKMKDIGDSSNLEFSKLMQAWCRRLPYFLRKNNVILLLNSHQNQKINMSGFGGSLIPADVAAEYNKTKIGGNATNQNSLTQIILRYEGQEKNGKEVIGKKVKARIIKNTAGSENEILSYLIKSKNFSDEGDYQESCLDFSYGFATMLSEKSLPYSITLYGKQVSCKALNLTKVHYSEFYDSFVNNDNVKIRTAQSLGIQGYEDTLVDNFDDEKQDIEVEQKEEYLEENPFESVNLLDDDVET